MNTNEVVTTSVSVGTTVYALANIQEVLGVIVLVLSVINILFNMGYRVYKHIKSKNYEEISKEIDNAKNEIQKYIEGENKNE